MSARTMIVTLLAVSAGPGPALTAAIPKARPTTAAQAEQQDRERKRFPELSGNQAWDAFQDGVLFLDARPAADFGYGRVPRAISLPYRAADFESSLAAFLRSRPMDRGIPLVVYCQGCCSTDSLYLALRLEEAGFSRVQLYQEGFPGWARANRPIERG